MQIDYFSQPEVNNYDPAYSNGQHENFLGIGKKARARATERKAQRKERISARNAHKMVLAEKGIAAPSFLDSVGKLASNLLGAAPANANILNPATGILMNGAEVDVLRNEQEQNGGTLTPEQIKQTIESLRTGGKTDIEKYLPYIIGIVVVFFFMKK